MENTIKVTQQQEVPQEGYFNVYLNGRPVRSVVYYTNDTGRTLEEAKKIAFDYAEKLKEFKPIDEEVVYQYPEVTTVN